jgi:exosome complex RNA-binding protein Csl4
MAPLLSVKTSTLALLAAYCLTVRTKEYAVITATCAQTGTIMMQNPFTPNCFKL